MPYSCNLSDYLNGIIPRNRKLKIVTPVAARMRYRSRPKKLAIIQLLLISCNSSVLPAKTQNVIKPKTVNPLLPTVERTAMTVTGFQVKLVTHINNLCPKL